MKKQKAQTVKKRINPPKISQKKRELIVNDIKAGLTYSEIVKRHKVSKSFITKMKKIAGIQGADKLKARSEKIQAMTNDLLVIKEVNKLVNLIDSNSNFANIANKVMTIVDDIDRKERDLDSRLNDINNKLTEFLETKTEIAEDDKLALLKRIKKASYDVSDYFKITELKLKAIKEFKDIQRIFIELESKIKDFKGIQTLMFALFYGFKTLTDKDYLKYRNFVIEQYPETRSYFLAYEGVGRLEDAEFTYSDGNEQGSGTHTKHTHKDKQE